MTQLLSKGLVPVWTLLFCFEALEVATSNVKEMLVNIQAMCSEATGVGKGFVCLSDSILARI